MPPKRKGKAVKKKAAAAAAAPDPDLEALSVPPPDPEEPEDSGSDETQSQPLTQTSKRKAPQKLPLKLSETQEDEVFEWVQAHPELYDKSHPSFLKREVKATLWREKAADMGLKEVDGEYTFFKYFSHFFFLEIKT